MDLPTANIIGTTMASEEQESIHLGHLIYDETACIAKIKAHRANGFDFYGDEEELTRCLEPIEWDWNSYTDDKRPYIRKYAEMMGELERIRKDIEVAKETIKDIDLTPQQVKIEVKEYASKFEASLAALTHRFECQTEELKLEHSQRIEAMGEKINRLERMVGVMASPIAPQYGNTYNQFTLNHVVHTNDEFMFQVIINRIELSGPCYGFTYVMESLLICIYHNRIKMLCRIMERYDDDTPLQLEQVSVPYIIVEMLKTHTIFNATYPAVHNGANTRIVKQHNGSYYNPKFDSALHMAAAFGRVEIIDIMIGYIAALRPGDTVVIPVPSGDNGNKICAILRENGVTSMPRF
jgi:hypothetical protein